MDKEAIINNEKEKISSFEEFTNFLADIAFRLKALEEEVAELKKEKIDINKIKTMVNDKLDIMKTYGLK